MILTLRNRLKVLIYLGAAMIIVVSMLEGGPSPGLSINRLSIVEAGLIAVISLFDRYAWRWWTIPRLLRTGPVLRGTWRGVIRPTEGDQQEIVAYLSVRQTFSGIALRLMTEESMSESSTAQLTQEAEGLAVVEYVFQNIPRDSFRLGSPIHFGAARLEGVGPHPQQLEGSYFTSRRTSGELAFSKRKTRVVHSFKDAEEIFGQ